MNEKNLIQDFRRIIDLIPVIESRIRHSKDSGNLIQQLEKTKMEKEEIVSQLKVVPDKSLTKKKLENVKNMIDSLHTKLSKVHELKFSRDQGLIVHGFIFIKIVEDISYSLDHDLLIPSEYYLEVGSELNVAPIIQILEESIQLLNAQKIDNYVDLFEFVRSIQKQIVTIDADCGRMKI